MAKSGQSSQEDISGGTDSAEVNRQLRKQVAQLEMELARLRLSEEQYRMIFERAGSGFAHVELDGRFINVNEELCRMLGYSRDELLTRTWTSITHPDHLPSNLAGNERMKSGEIGTYSVDKRYIRKDGQSIWAHLTVSLIRDAEGEPKYFVSVMEDITERKREQELLHQSRQRLQSILDHTTAVIYMKDLAGRYELINRRYEELFHVTHQQIIGKTDFEIFPLEQATKLRENDARVVQGGVPLELEEEVSQDDGIHTYISIKVPLHDELGNPVGICGISTDITERKQWEADLLAAKECAEEANLAKSRFLANVSHEIRTPIMAILAGAEVISSGGVPGGGTREHGEVILRSGRHLLSLVNDLLDQSLIEAGRLDVVRETCNLIDIVDDVRAVSQPLVGKGVEFRVRFETDLPRLILTDRKRLTQTIINLVHNAIKFTQFGHIQLDFSIGMDKEMPWLLVRVKDTGKGISAENLSRIFEPFTQLETGLSRPRSGIGLGLALARHIAERLGGTLDVQSQPGKGSEFRLRVPVGPISTHDWISPHEAAVWPKVEGRSSLITGLKGHVLFAEDADDVRRLVSDALRRAGAVVTAVEDGMLAVRAARSTQFDLILLDIRMPGLDGFEAASAIRAMGYAGPMIALTASTTLSEKGRILAAGFDDLWPKPISLETIVERSSDYLETTEVRNSTFHQNSLADVKSEYAAKLADVCRRLKKAVRVRNNTEVREILHQLLGTSGVLGFSDVSEKAVAVYDRFKTGDLSDEDPQLAELYRLMEAVADHKP